MFLMVLLREAVLTMGSAGSLCKQYDPLAPTLAQTPWIMNTHSFVPQ